MNYPDDHPDQDIRNALVKLSDAIVMWERATGRESVLIYREHGGFNYRTQSGKPGLPDDVTDEQMVITLDATDYTKKKDPKP